jgi:hypothetical protein
MTRTLKKLILLVLLLTLCCSPPTATANALGDFFAKIGRSISKYRKPTPTPTPQKPVKSGNANGANEVNKTVGSSPIPMAPAPTPTPTPVDIRPAMLAPPSARKRDLPYGVAVPNKPGLVTSPYAPDQGYVDVSAFPSSTEVLDPFTGKAFRTP